MNRDTRSLNNKLALPFVNKPISNESSRDGDSFFQQDGNGALRLITKQAGNLYQIEFDKYRTQRDMGGWKVGHSDIRVGHIVLDSKRESVIVYDDNKARRVALGRIGLTDDYGLVGYASDGATRLFYIYGNEAKLGGASGWTIEDGYLTGVEGIIRTSESGVRVEVNGASNSISLFDSSDNEVVKLGYNLPIVGLHGIYLNADDGGNSGVVSFNNSYIRLAYGGYCGAISPIIGGIVNITASSHIQLGASASINGSIDISDSYKMDSNDIIDSSGNQTANMKTRSYLHFGHNDVISSDLGTPASTDAYTVDGAQNTRGYCMTRAGIITGISAQYRITDATSDGKITLTVEKNGSSTSVVALQDGISSTSNTANAYSIANTEAFSAGDTINVSIVVLEQAADVKLDIQDIAILVEILS